MLIISIEIMKTIDERERCDTRCIVMRWNNSKVSFRQLIISVRDNKNNRWKRNAKRKTKKPKKKQQQKANKDRKEQGRDRSCSERVGAKWFSCAFRLAFLQMISKASLLFKLNSELALSITLKQRKLNESKRVTVECRCLKIWDLLSFLTCSSIQVLKRRQVSPV